MWRFKLWPPYFKSQPHRPANITGHSSKCYLNYKSTSSVTHPVGVLIVAAVLGERRFRPLSQEDLGADVAVTGGPSPEHGALRHLAERRGAAAHGEGRLVPEVTRGKKSPPFCLSLITEPNEIILQQN